MSSYKLINWLVFILLCLIWGSSFILMKFGLYDAAGRPLLSPYQVAAIRILTAGLVLVPSFIWNLKKIPFRLSGYMFLSGLLGNFFAAFLFCIAETKIDSDLAGTLNALTPIFVLLIGALVYKNKVSKQKIFGIFIGLAGSILLFVTSHHQGIGDLNYVGLVVLATIFYGANINMVRQNLNGVPSTIIASFAFVSLMIPSAFILWYTGFFALPLTNKIFVQAVSAASVLGVVGTALAAILFYMLVKRGGSVFASLVTYGIPFVAMAWGKWYGENITYGAMLSLLVILVGVWLTNKKPKERADVEKIMPGIQHSKVS